jgi:ribosomal protein L32
MDEKVSSTEKRMGRWHFKYETMKVANHCPSRSHILSHTIRWVHFAAMRSTPEKFSLTPSTAGSMYIHEDI